MEMIFGILSFTFWQQPEPESVNWFKSKWSIYIMAISTYTPRAAKSDESIFQIPSVKKLLYGAAVGNRKVVFCS